MRGIWKKYPDLPAQFGIIPAGAGHFKAYTSQNPRPWDHPRRCGAFRMVPISGLSSWGSSPQVRGIFQHAIPHDMILGIIPAGAGHLQPGMPELQPPGDHPRRCGAFAALAIASLKLGGSSPQVRGICGPLIARRKGFGIIPAGAGHFVPPPRQ